MHFLEILEGADDASFTRQERDVGGKRRLVYEPNETMRLVHGRLIALMRERFKVCFPSATGGMPDIARTEHILRHRRWTDGRPSLPRYFFKTDLWNAYGSLPLLRLAELLCETCWKHDIEVTPLEVLGFLNCYCSPREGGLALGGPAAPWLFNWYCAVTIDLPLTVFLNPQGGRRYTRYYDDLLFSSSTPFGGKTRKRIMRVIRNAGFAPHDGKTRRSDLRRHDLVIVGLRVVRDGRLYHSTRYLARVEGVLHRALKYADVPPDTLHGHLGEVESIIRGRKSTRQEQRIRTLHSRWREEVLQQEDSRMPGESPEPWDWDYWNTEPEWDDGVDDIPF
jgi:hypothetical protein